MSDPSKRLFQTQCPMCEEMRFLYSVPERHGDGSFLEYFVFPACDCVERTYEVWYSVEGYMKTQKKWRDKRAHRDIEADEQEYNPESDPLLAVLRQLAEDGKEKQIAYGRRIGTSPSVISMAVKMLCSLFLFSFISFTASAEDPWYEDPYNDVFTTWYENIGFATDALIGRQAGAQIYHATPFGTLPDPLPGGAGFSYLRIGAIGRQTDGWWYTLEIIEGATKWVRLNPIWIRDEEMGGAIDVSNVTFTTQYRYLTGTISAYIKEVTPDSFYLRIPHLRFTESASSSITLDWAPSAIDPYTLRASGTKIYADYITRATQ